MDILNKKAAKTTKLFGWTIYPYCSPKPLLQRDKGTKEWEDVEVANQLISKYLINVSLTGEAKTQIKQFLSSRALHTLEHRLSELGGP